MNKRKNRGGPVRAQRQRSLVTEGVYNNAPFMHAATGQVGNIARIKTASGQVWEGVFKTYSQNFEVVLEVAAKVENPDAPDCRLLTDTCIEKLIFKSSDILSMTFKNVDLDYPMRDTFQTDTAISAKLNGSKSEEKELEPWDAGQVNGNDALSLELDAANGWDVNDMFKKNEQEYGVQSTFDHSLRGYTVPLQTSDSPDFREAQAKADQIANEIESQPAHKARLELENGDEEAAFASVARPNQQQESSNGKYIPPAKRKGQNNGKLVRSTPPPSSGSSSQNSPSPKDTRPPMSYPPHGSQHPVHQNNIHNVPNTHTPPQSHPIQPPQQIQHVPPPQHMHNAMPQVVPPQIQNMGPPQHQQPMPVQPHPAGPSPPIRPNSHTPPHQYQQGPPPRQGAPHGMPLSGPPPHVKPQMNGEAKSGPQQRQQRHQQQYQQQQERGGPVPQVGHPQGVMPLQAYQEMKPQESPQPHPIPQQPPQPIIPQSLPPPRQQPPTPQHRHEGPPTPQPRHEGPPTTPQSQDSLKDLHAFSQDFKLAPMPPPHSHSPNLPQGPPQHLPQAVPQNMGVPPHMSGAESPQMVPHMVQNMPPVQGHNSSGASPNSSSSNLSVMNSSSSGEQSMSGGPQKQPSPAQSPQSIESEKMQNTVAKSKLNPNAKEFVLNPTAKPFQPRYVKSPSTPSASRPHTPQTPSHSPYIPTVSGPGGPPMPTVMMPMYHIGISQAQYQPPPPQTNRIRKIPMGQIRTDVASQMQHAAAVTGQPLLAPAPIPQLFYNPSAAAAAHNMNQAAAYQPATVAAMHAATLRMYNDAAAAAAQPPQIEVPQFYYNPGAAAAAHGTNQTAAYQQHAATLRMYNDAAAAAGAQQQIQYLPPQPSGTPSPAQAQYNPAAVPQQQGPPQGYQTAPPPQGHPQIPMFCIPTQPHMLQNVPAYLQQGPPPPPQHQHVQVLVQHQHPSQQGNPHGPNP